jgi:hypothetical protein
MYDGRVGRWMTMDPYSQYHSPYLAMGNNPIRMIDPDGGSAWDIIFTSNGKEVKRIKTDIVDATYDISELSTPSEALVNDVSKVITEGGMDAFRSMYYDMVDYSSLNSFTNRHTDMEFFFNVSKTFELSSSGVLGKLINSSNSVRDAFYISQWTHSVIADGTTEMNALEHHVGSFLMTAKYGAKVARVITTSNEVRGLIINDRQSENVTRAIEGKGGTAFEWSDLKNNLIGRHYYRQGLYNKAWQWSWTDFIIFHLSYAHYYED